MKFNWKWLAIAIVIFAAVTSTEKSYGKWIFALTMIGILLNFGESKSVFSKVLPNF